MQPSVEPDSGALYGKVWYHAKVSACSYGWGQPLLASLICVLLYNVGISRGSNQSKMALRRSKGEGGRKRRKEGHGDSLPLVNSRDMSIYI